MTMRTMAKTRSRAMTILIGWSIAFGLMFSAETSAGSHTVSLSDVAISPDNLNVYAGDAVYFCYDGQFDYEASYHVQSDPGAVTAFAGDASNVYYYCFSVRFPKAGTAGYSVSTGMSGTITILPAARPNDFNGDGVSDILWRNANTGANEIWLSGDAATQQAVAGMINPAWTVAGSGDYNGDGRSDILWRNGSTGANTIWLSADSATPQAVTSMTDPNWIVVGSGDYNGDARSDILWRNRSTGANTIWLSGNAATQQAVARMNTLGWTVVGSGDYNGDGRDDILWRNRSMGMNVIWLSGNAATQQAVARVTKLTSTVAGSGDYNCDGRSDILWRNTTTGVSVIWFSANAATQDTVGGGITNQDWTVVGSGDYNADFRMNGCSNILWRNRSTGENTAQSILTDSSNWWIKPISPMTDLSWSVVGTRE